MRYEKASLFNERQQTMPMLKNTKKILQELIHIHQKERVEYIQGQIDKIKKIYWR